MSHSPSMSSLGGGPLSPTPLSPLSPSTNPFRALFPPINHNQSSTSDFAFHRLPISTLTHDDVAELKLNRPRPSPLRANILKDVADKVKTVGGSLGAAMIEGGEEVKVRGKWSSKFNMSKNMSIAARDETRATATAIRKAYRPRTTNTSWLDNFSAASYAVNPQTNASTGARQTNCLVCWKSVGPGSYTHYCQLCPGVAHINCVGSAARDILWRCGSCVAEISIAEAGAAVTLDEMQTRRSQFFAARLLQSRMMRLVEVSRYRRFRFGLISLQAVVRMQATRRSFLGALSFTHKPVRIRVCEFKKVRACDSDTKGMGNPMCMVTVFKNSKGTEIDEGERHLFRFDTLGQYGTSGKWLETFTVYSLDCNVDLIATVVDKDDAGRIDFYGQAVMNAGAALKHAAITGKKQRFKMNLGAMTVEPRETSNRQKLKMDKINEPVSGKVYLELFTFSNVTTKCGVLEEMLSALITGAKKKWWAVLGDLRGAGLELMLFSHQGDSRPKVSIPIRSGTHIVWHEDVVIKIGSMDSTYFFTTPRADDRNDWFNKMTGKYSEILEAGAAKFLALQTARIKRETLGGDYNEDWGSEDSGSAVDADEAARRRSMLNMFGDAPKPEDEEEGDE